MITEKNLARLAGLFYLIVAVTGGFSELIVRRLRDGRYRTWHSSATNLRGDRPLSSARWPDV